MTSPFNAFSCFGPVEAEQRNATGLVALDQDELLVAHGIASKTSGSCAAQPLQ